MTQGYPSGTPSMLDPYRFTSEESPTPSDYKSECPTPELEQVGPIAVPLPSDAEPERKLDDDEHFSAFRRGAKIFVVVLASTSAFMSPFAINIYMPAVPAISEELHINSSQTLLSVTLYMIMQGLSPSFWAPLSDTYGRRPILILTFVVFLIANLGLSFAKVYWLLLVLRMLQACGASSAISIGAGCISDVSRLKERGTYMGFFQTGTLLGPAVGPIIGGLMSQRWDWHAVFFFLSAFGGVYLLFMILVLPESLRALVGDGSLMPYGIWRALVPIRMVDRPTNTIEDGVEKQQWMNKPPKLNIRAMGFDRPWRAYLQADIAMMIVSFAIPFGVFTMVSSSLSPTLSTTYHYNAIYSGLCFLPLGVGSAAGSIVSGKLLDYDFARAHKKHGNKMNLHHARLQHAQLFNLLFTAMTIANGWCLQKGVHIAAPMVFQFFLSVFAILYFNAMYVPRLTQPNDPCRPVPWSGCIRHGRAQHWSLLGRRCFCRRGTVRDRRCGKRLDVYYLWFGQLRDSYSAY